MRRVMFIAGLSVLALGSAAWADDFRAYDVEIIQPWTRATAPGETTAMVFMKLDNTGGNPAVTPLERIPRVDEDECVGCNLCSLVCPVDGCITMERIDKDLPVQSWEQRTAAR